MQKSVNLFCQKCVKSQNLFWSKCVKSQNVCIFVYFSSKKRNGAIALHITLSGNLARFLNNLVAPQVDVPNLERLLQARPQEPPEVNTNYSRRV